MKTKISLVLAAVVCVGAFAISEAHSAPVSFSVPIHAAQDLLPVGSTLTNTVAVPADAQGRTCTISTENGQSVHTGASVTFVSASTVTLQGTEETPDAQRSGQITLGQTITATAVVGQDPAYAPGLGGFSLDAAVVDCPDVPTTTTAPTTTTTTQPPQVSPAEASIVQVAGVVVISPAFTG
jgi:hypothetical protein